jgi:predicted DNA-binding ribbon-helix-helix protein
MDTSVVSVRLETDFIKHLKRMAHFLSLERDQDLSYSDLIREAVFNSFPLPNKDTNAAEQKD